jgi:hypothetical protein
MKRDEDVKRKEARAEHMKDATLYELDLRQEDHEEEI